MFCRNCGNELMDGAIVCGRCGFAPGNGTSFCPHCGRPVMEGQAICLNCGFSLEPPKSDKSKLAAGLLGLFLGGYGVHNFYLGNTKRAVIQLLLTISPADWRVYGDLLRASLSSQARPAIRQTVRADGCRIDRTGAEGAG